MFVLWSSGQKKDKKLKEISKICKHFKQTWNTWWSSDRIRLITRITIKMAAKKYFGNTLNYTKSFCIIESSRKIRAGGFLR